jgi:hypothetical protein
MDHAAISGAVLIVIQVQQLALIHDEAAQRARLAVRLG